MKVYLSALLFAAALASALAIVVHIYGPHSTPGIWMMVAGLPGTVIGTWAGLLTRQRIVVFYFATVLANSAFYFILVKGFVWLKRRLMKSSAVRYSNSNVS
jgi:arginine exporter protein ArgO